MCPCKRCWLFDLTDLAVPGGDDAAGPLARPPDAGRGLPVSTDLRSLGVLTEPGTPVTGLPGETEKTSAAVWGSAVDDVLRIVERSNQRGGRMLSMVDLVAAETLSLGQAAWLMGCVDSGSSWLVGASPGGAGKTTIMGAMLAVLPPDSRIMLTNPGTGWESAGAGDCVVSYEIGSGPYDAYVWGRDVDRLTELGTKGVRIVTNLHADTLEQARQQVVDDNGAAAEGFDAFELFIPVRMTGTAWPRRRIVQSVHRRQGGAWRAVDRDAAERQADASIVSFLQACLRDDIRRVEDVRREWVSVRYRSGYVANDG